MLEGSGGEFALSILQLCHQGAVVVDRDLAVREHLQEAS